MVMSKKTTGLPLAIASKTIGSAIVTDMFVMRRGAAGSYGAAMPGPQVCNARFGDRRTRRGHASAGRAAAASRDLCQTKAARHVCFAGMDAKVKEATTMASTRPQRLQQARIASRKAAAAEC